MMNKIASQNVQKQYQYHSKIIQQSNEQCVERSSRKLTLTFRKQSNVKIDVLQHEEEVADHDSPSSMTVL
jgi:hypothetical protein